MELYTNSRRIIECAAKHGQKYGHAALESLDLLKEPISKNNACSLNEFSFAPNTVLIESRKSNENEPSIKEKLEDVYNSLAKSANREIDSVLDYKYAMHLLDRIFVSPFSIQNDITASQLDFINEKLENSGSNVDINESAIAMKRVVALKNALNWQLDKESELDLFAILNCESFFVFRLHKDGIPVSILQDFWASISPERYSNVSDKLLNVYRATSEVLEGMDGNETQITSEEYLQFKMDAAKKLYDGIKMLASFSDYGAHLRQAMEWVQKTAITVTLEGGYIDRFTGLPVIKKANQLLNEMFGLNPACAHIPMNISAALELCGAYMIA